MKDLLRSRPDGFATGLIICAAAATILLVLFASTLSTLWLVLVSIGLMAGLLFLATPEKRMALWALYVFTLPLGAAKAITFEPYFYFGENPDGFVLNLPDMPLFVLAIWWFAEVLLGKAPKLRSPILLPLLATLVWRAATIAVAPDKSLAFWNVLSHTKFLFVVVWATSYLTERRWINMTIALFIIDLAIQASVNVASFYVHGAITVFGIIPVGEQQIGGVSIFRATGTMGPHNSQVQFYEMVVPLALVLFYRAPKLVFRVACIITLVLTLLASIFTFSRGGWIGILITLTTATWFLYQRRLISIALLAAIVAAGSLSLAAFVLGPKNNIGRRLTDTPAQAMTSRWHMNWAATRIIRDHPIMGVGTNNATQVYRDYFPDGVPQECIFLVKVGDYRLEKHILPIHNRYLLTTAERGIVGLALYLWFLWTFVRISFRIIGSRDPWLAGFGIWLVAANSGILIHNLINEFTWLNVMEFHYLLAGMASAIYMMALREGQIDPPAPRGRRSRRKIRPRHSTLPAAPQPPP